jgi:hypothetical protein
MDEREGRPLDPSNPADAADAAAIVDEYRTMIEFEATWRATAAVDEAEKAEALGQAVDWPAVNERAFSLLESGRREAQAVHYDGETNRIMVDDVYGAERLQGAGRGELGGNIYERLLYMSRSTQVLHVGFYTPSETFRRSHRDSSEVVAGASPPLDYRRGYVRVRSHVAWALPMSMRGFGYVGDPANPTRTTMTHETNIHPFRRWAGMAEDGHRRHTGGMVGRGSEDNAPDLEGHFLFEILGDWKTYSLPCDVVPSRSTDYWSGPTVEFFGGV